LILDFNGDVYWIHNNKCIQIDTEVSNISIEKGNAFYVKYFKKYYVGLSSHLISKLLIFDSPFISWSGNTRDDYDYDTIIVKWDKSNIRKYSIKNILSNSLYKNRKPLDPVIINKF
jgi:hypothetical protein